MVEVVSRGDGARHVRRRRLVALEQADARDVAAFAAGLRVAGVDDEAVQPSVEAVDVAEHRQVAPCAQQGLLRGVLGTVRVAQDPVGKGVAAIGGRRHQGCECVLVALPGPLDELGLHWSAPAGAAHRTASQSMEPPVPGTFSGPRRLAQPGPSSSLPPGADEAAIAYAIGQRKTFGLRSDEAWVRQMAADPRARTQLLDFPMLPEEEAEFQARQTSLERTAQVVAEYGASHHDEFDGGWVDQARHTVVAAWTASLDLHRVAILAQLAARAPSSRSSCGPQSGSSTR